MNLGIDGRRAAVAAASRGLGFAVARALAEEGVQVAICARDRSAIDAAASRIGPAVTPLVCDVSTIDGARSFIEQAEDALGDVEILVANAAGPPPGDFASTPLTAYSRAVEQNMLAMISMCDACIPDMRRRRWGRVVAITSIGVRQPIPELILSNTARAGLTGFLKTLAREVAGDGLTVNSLQPGLHATNRVRDVFKDRTEDAVAAIPARALGRPEDFGRIAAMLCSEHARFITGAAIPVDGGANVGLQ